MGEGQKNVPKLRFKGYEDAWEQRKLKEIGEIQTGNTPPTTDSQNYSEDGMLWVTPTDIEELVITKTAKRISEIGKKKARIASKGSILVTCIASIGKNTLLSEDAAFNQQINSISPNGEYDSYFLLTQSFKISEKMANSAAAATMQIVNKSQFSNLDTILPIYTEQVEIGRLFLYLDNIITLHQRKYDALKSMKKTLLSKMFPKDGKDVPEIRFKEFTDAWEQRKLGEVGTTYTGLSGKTKEDFGHGNGRFITYMNVFSNAVASSEMVEPVEIDDRQNKVIAGDVLFTTSSETPEEVGMSSVWLANSKNTYLNSFCFGYRPIIPFDPYYLAFMLRSSLMRKKISFLAQGISRYNISKNKMMDIEIPVPIMSEQHQIGEYFRNLDYLITLHQRKLEELKNMKKTLLQQMFV